MDDFKGDLKAHCERDVLFCENILTDLSGALYCYLVIVLYVCFVFITCARALSGVAKGNTDQREQQHDGSSSIA